MNLKVFTKHELHTEAAGDGFYSNYGNNVHSKYYPLYP